jgi:predicted transcriptional regulator
MIVKISKTIGKKESVLLTQEWEKDYGSFDSLQHKVMISKCSDPKLMDVYIQWKYISSGAELQEAVIFENAELFDVLTPRRVELLELISNNDFMSIRDLALKIKRNYKNVYDDLKSLARYELIELKGRGRAMKPHCKISHININFED